MTTTLNSPPFFSCSVSSHYPSVLPTTRNQIHRFLKSNHVNIIPYTSSSKTDCWDALVDLDPGTSSTYVKGIYTQGNIKVSDRADASVGWNREHLWPKSYGVGYDGPDFSDLHMLRASDWGTNSARSNKLFGQCYGAGECISPASTRAEASSTSDKDHWLPPVEVRGDIARAMFYMDVRYSGDDDPDGVDLILSNCPEKTDEGSKKEGKLGLLNDLLKWHEEDPVSAEELERTGKVRRPVKW